MKYAVQFILFKTHFSNMYLIYVLSVAFGLSAVIYFSVIDTSIHSNRPDYDPMHYITSESGSNSVQIDGVHVVEVPTMIKTA